MIVGGGMAHHGEGTVSVKKAIVCADCSLAPLKVTGRQVPVKAAALPTA